MGNRELGKNNFDVLVTIHIKLPYISAVPDFLRIQNQYALMSRKEQTRILQQMSVHSLSFIYDWLYTCPVGT